MPSVTLRTMRISDYDAALRIWEKSEGLSLTKDDAKPGISLYLRRNIGLCFVATIGGRVVGTVLCGHDGRRAVLRHLAVVPSQRKKGIGRALVERCLKGLRTHGITKCNLYVMNDNPEGLRYWEHLGYRPVEDNYRTLQIDTASL
jgi:N-acetylglutamate synthase